MGFSFCDKNKKVVKKVLTNGKSFGIINPAVGDYISLV